MNARCLLVANVAAIAVLAPVCILGPNILAGLPLTRYHWSLLGTGYLSAAALVTLSVRREQRITREKMTAALARAKGANHSPSSS